MKNLNARYEHLDCPNLTLMSLSIYQHSQEDLLQKCLTLDPSRRIAVKMALQHDFFKVQEQQQGEG